MSSQVAVQSSVHKNVFDFVRVIKEWLEAFI